MDSVFEDLRWAKPLEFGFYKVSALMEAKWNSGVVENWNNAGGLFNEQPDLFGRRCQK